MTEPLTTKTRLIGKILIDWCTSTAQQNEYICFDKALCDGMQNIRFTSDNINAVFPQNKFDDGYILCYEINNTSKETLLTVKIDKRHIGKRQKKTFDKLLYSFRAADTDDEIIILKCWNISDEIENISQMTEVLNQLFDYEISYFETTIYNLRILGKGDALSCRASPS